MTCIIIAIIAVAAIVLLASIIIFILFHYGMVISYQPVKKARENQIRVACVGDSITYGFMVRNRRQNCYPAVLNKLLGENYCVNNFAYTNRTAIKSADYPLTNEKIYGKSLAFKPDIVVILLGTNDSKANNWNKEKFVADYGEMIDDYLSLESKPKVFVLIPPPLFEVRGKVLYKLRQDVVENEIVPAVKRIAKANGAELIDIFSVFEGRNKLFADGVHPNAKGCKLMAQAVYNAITPQ